MFYVLATATGIPQCFRYLRTSVLALSGTFVSLAATIAGFLIAFKLIRISYSLMGDEQNGGIGGIKLSELLHPVIVLALILGYQYVISFVDWGANTLSSSIMKQEREMKNNFMNNVSDMSDAILKVKDANLSFEVMAAKTDMENGKGVDEVLGNLNRGYRADTGEDMDSDQLKNLKKLLRKYVRRNRTDAVTSAVVDKEMPGTLTGLVMLILQLVFKVVIGLGQLILSIMALLGPFALAFSVLEPWKNNPVTLLGKYMEVSLWPAVASLIMWFVCSAGALVSNGKTADLNAQIWSSVQNIYDNDMLLASVSEIRAALTTSTFIIIAGIIAMLSVPDITNSIFNLGHIGGGVTQASGEIMKAPGKAMSEGAKMAAGGMK